MVTITEHGIKENPIKCQAIINMMSPTNVKEMYKLNRRLVAFTRFMSKSIDNHALFFNLLKNNKTFE